MRERESYIISWFFLSSFCSPSSSLDGTTLEKGFNSIDDERGVGLFRISPTRTPSIGI